MFVSYVVCSVVGIRFPFKDLYTRGSFRSHVAVRLCFLWLFELLCSLRVGWSLAYHH